MHLDPTVVLASAVVGLLVGATGAGGGALMTPMLVLVFSVKPSTAVSSDLVAAVLMRPVGAAVHLARGTVHLRLVAWLSAGSVPAAVAGAVVLHEIGGSAGAEGTVQRLLGAALLLGAAAMVLRVLLDRRSGGRRTGALDQLRVRAAAAVAVGAVGGALVGLTSVGSGSLMIVLLLFAHPRISAKRLVGTDLTQAVPLTLAAAAGAAVFGHVSLPLTASIALGSVPAVLVGALLSSRAPDRVIRPVVTFVVLLSGLKYAGLGTTDVGLAALATLGAGTAGWALRVRGRPPARASTA